MYCICEHIRRMRRIVYNCIVNVVHAVSGGATAAATAIAIYPLLCCSRDIIDSEGTGQNLYIRLPLECHSFNGTFV